MTNAQLEHLKPAAIRAARALLHWDNGKLAVQAGLSRNTVQAMLNSDEFAGTLRSLKAVVTALEKSGIEFVTDPETGAFGVLYHPPRR